MADFKINGIGWILEWLASAIAENFVKL